MNIRRGGCTFEFENENWPNPEGIGANRRAASKGFGKRQAFNAEKRRIARRAARQWRKAATVAKAPAMTAPGFLQSSALVVLGGGLGAWLRFAVGHVWSRAIGPVAAGAFPWATFSVNVIGSLAMGLLAGWLARHGQGGESWRLLLGVGLLGGFTTFSAFSLEIALLIQRGAIGQAVGYALGSVLAGMAGLYLGLLLMREAL